MSQSDSSSTPRVVPIATFVVGLWAVAVAALVSLGSDLMWVVALGDTIRDTGAVPDGIPFASAPQDGWHNPIVVSELLLSLVHSSGGAGLAALQVLVVASVLAVLVTEGRRVGGGEVAIALTVSAVIVGGAASFVITRLPTLSLLPFVVAVAVMRRQHDEPSRALWWLVPIYLLWGNLHGAVLVGLAVLGVFLVASRHAGPIGRRLGVGLGCAASLVLTSAGSGTPAYYLSALGNEAAARGTDLWARPDLTQPLDLALVVMAAVLLVRCARRPTPLWEWVAAAGLLIGTVSAARHGVWLLLFLAPAAVRPRRKADSGRIAVPRHGWATTATAISAAVGVTVLLALRADAVLPRGADAVDAVRDYAAGRPVLADEPFAETLAQGGVTVWMANPIDAFPREQQAEFLDFLHDGATPPSADVSVAAVSGELAVELTRSGHWTESFTTGDVMVLRRLP